MQILILDDHPLVRQGMISILKINSVSNVMFQAGTIASALDITAKEAVDVALVDLSLGRENGFDFITRARAIKPEIKYVVITASTNDDDWNYARQLDVDGYIVKDAFVEEIIHALNMIRQGKKYYSNSMLSKKMDETIRVQNLTRREREVLQLLKEGRTNAQISEELCISETTTKKHVSNILSKLNLKHRVDAILYCYNH